MSSGSFRQISDCHPEAAESSASPRTPNEGPVQPAGAIARADASGTASKSIGPSARKKRGPQNDKPEVVAARLPISGGFPLFIIKIRLLFASFYMYNPARLVLHS